MSKDNKNKSVMYRKVGFISLILVAVAIVLISYFIIRNSNSKVTSKNIFDDQDLSKYSEVSQEDFLKRFSKFELTSKKITAASKNSEGEIVNGLITLEIEEQLNQSVTFKDNKFSIKFRVGLSGHGLHGYKSEISSEYSVTANNNKSNTKSAMTVTLDEILDVEQLTLYALVTWDEVIGNITNSYYSILSFNHSEYYKD